MEWVRFHHNTLMNATLACYIEQKGTDLDVSENSIFTMIIQYRNDPRVPIERKFELRGSMMIRSDPNSNEVDLWIKLVAASHPQAVTMSKRGCGADYWATGAYLLMVRFNPEKKDEMLPFYKHFAIDRLYQNARLACRDLAHQLKENLEYGQKMDFCCGRIEGLSDCCCGGWTHRSVSCHFCTQCETAPNHSPICGRRCSRAK